MVEEDEGGEENMVWYTRERYLVEELSHFPPNRLAPLLLLIEQKDRELILHHFLPQAGDHSMALVLKIWCIGYAMRHQTWVG